ncbi:DUF202 domain-containing protein [Aeromicrobium sp. CF4.19]|uniref:DUF202 domain-containing protein n=1 Tax=Aeromicrobium sp. CF4.19 TaxID=3373082 RepID=UPI003EE5DE86
MTPVPPGLQRERTALSWQRTALALMAGSLLVVRLSYEVLGAWALVGAAFAFGLAAWVLVEGRRTYLDRTGLRPRRRSRAAGHTAALATAVAVLCLLELVALVVAAS